MRSSSCAALTIFLSFYCDAAEWSLPQHTPIQASELPPAFKMGSTGWLQDRDRLFSAAATFFGDSTATFDAYRPTSVYEQFAYSFSGSAENDITLPDGKVLYVADAPHADKYNGFLVTLGRSDHVVAAGFMRTLCEPDVPRPGRRNCDADPTLVVYHGKGITDTVLNNEIRTYFKVLAKHYNDEKDQLPSGFNKKLAIRVKVVGT